MLLREDLQLFVVADGAGGHAAGDVAAQLGADTISAVLEDRLQAETPALDFDDCGVPQAARWLVSAVHRANAAVYAAAQQEASQRGMGSTVVALLFVPDTGQLHLAHVGDSRCYRWRGGHLEQLTRDHSLVNDVLEERPDIDGAVLARLPRNVVTRALGMAPRIRVAISTHEAVRGDRYLLCTDGLSGFVPHQRLVSILAEARPPGALAQLLINAADEAGGHDNVGVIIVDCLDVRASVAREWERSAAEHRVVRARAVQASEPEILLVGIEEVDLEEAIATLTDPERERDSCDMLLDILQKRGGSR